jgi:hypothetical protein
VWSERAEEAERQRPRGRVPGGCAGGDAGGVDAVAVHVHAVARDAVAGEHAGEEPCRRHDRVGSEQPFAQEAWPVDERRDTAGEVVVGLRATVRGAAQRQQFVAGRVAGELGRELGRMARQTAAAFVRWSVAGAAVAAHQDHARAQEPEVHQRHDEPALLRLGGREQVGAEVPQVERVHDVAAALAQMLGEQFGHARVAVLHALPVATEPPPERHAAHRQALYDLAGLAPQSFLLGVARIEREHVDRRGRDAAAPGRPRVRTTRCR